MKLHHLFSLSIFLLYIPFAQGVLVEDKAVARQSTDVYFKSDVENLLTSWKNLDCLFGGSMFYELFDSDRKKLKAHLQIEKYLTEKKFRIKFEEVISIISKAALQRCKVSNLEKKLKKNTSLKIEVFLQELDIERKKKSEKKALDNLQKLLDAKFPVFFYE